MNIISRMHVPHLPYILYRGQAIGRVNKEAICQSTKRPHEGKPQVSVKPTKVTEPPDDLLDPCLNTLEFPSVPTVLSVPDVLYCS